MDVKVVPLLLCIAICLVGIPDAVALSCKACTMVTGQTNDPAGNARWQERQRLVNNQDCKDNPENVTSETCPEGHWCASQTFRSVVNATKDGDDGAGIQFLSYRRLCYNGSVDDYDSDSQCAYRVSTAEVEATAAALASAQGATVTSVAVSDDTRCFCKTDDCNVHKLDDTSGGTRPFTSLLFCVSVLFVAAFF